MLTANVDYFLVRVLTIKNLDIKNSEESTTKKARPDYPRAPGTLIVPEFPQGLPNSHPSLLRVQYK